MILQDLDQSLAGSRDPHLQSGDGDAEETGTFGGAHPTRHDEKQGLAIPRGEAPDGCQGLFQVGTVKGALLGIRIGMVAVGHEVERLEEPPAGGGAEGPAAGYREGEAFRGLRGAIPPPSPCEGGQGLLGYLLGQVAVAGAPQAVTQEARRQISDRLFEVHEG